MQEPTRTKGLAAKRTVIIFEPLVRFLDDRAFAIPVGIIVGNGGRTVKVILKADIKGTGYQGEEVEVRGGFMRNFLFPKGQAVYATSDNKALFKSQEKTENSAKIQALKALSKSRRTLRNIPITFKRHVAKGQTPNNSVSAQNISDYLQKKGKLDIAADRIILPNNSPITTLGQHKIQVSLDLAGDTATLLAGAGADTGATLAEDAVVDLTVTVVRR